MNEIASATINYCTIDKAYREIFNRHQQDHRGHRITVEVVFRMRELEAAPNFNTGPSLLRLIEEIAHMDVTLTIERINHRNSFLAKIFVPKYTRVFTSDEEFVGFENTLDPLRSRLESKLTAIGLSGLMDFTMRIITELWFNPIGNVYIPETGELKPVVVVES
jgi:hypothetical protein